MKLNFTKLFVMLFAFGALSACEKDEPIDQVDTTTGSIKLNNKLMAVDGRDSYRPFNLAVTKPWKVVLTDEQKTWIEVTPSEGEGSYKPTTISVRAKQNAESKLPREADITFTLLNPGAENGSIVLKITQGTEYFMLKDSLAAVAYYNATDGPNWTKTWDLTKPIAQWGFKGQGGLTVSKQEWNGVWVTKDATGSRRINRIALFEDIGLKGKLPEQMKDLTAMEMFETAGLQLEGQTFSEMMDIIYTWPVLKSLWFTANCKLGNPLIPAKLADFRLLISFLASNHDFIGFEENFGQLKLAEDNKYVDFPELEGFSVTDGTLGGELRPECFDRMPKIIGIFLDNNELEGSLSPKIIQGKPDLMLLQVNDNRFTGDFPANIKNSALWATMSGEEGDAAQYFCPQKPGAGFTAGTCM